MIEHKYSTFWPRFWAGLLDGLVFWPWGFLRDWIFAHSSSIPLRVLYFSVDSSAFLVYSILMHGHFGQTLGKMACKVVVRDVTEARLSMRQAVLRDIISIAFLPFTIATSLPTILRGQNPYLPEHFSVTLWIFASIGLILFLVELITMLTNNKRRALHDFIAGSVVIQTAYAPSPDSTNRGLTMRSN